MKSVKVVIPLYKTDLDELELFSIKQTIAVLGKHKFALVCPDDLDLVEVEKLFQNIDYELNRFSPHFFKSIDSYNQLMLSELFYFEFSDVDYILICQTDVFVFKDELDFWCQKNYDYIGAPWIASQQNIWNQLALIIRNLTNKNKKSSHHFFKVGNGGFSLRKVETMQKITNQLKEEIEYFQKNKDERKYFQEDIFISLYAQTHFPEMKIPDYKEAAAFCIDRKPEIAYKINKNQLPFACHGFNKPKVRKFWESIFVEINR